jgi:hypothetical protein
MRAMLRVGTWMACVILAGGATSTAREAGAEREGDIEVAGGGALSLGVRAGDVFFSRGTSVLGRLIRWVERDPGEEPTWANHVGVVVKAGWLVPDGGAEPLAQTVEALWRVEHTRWWLRHRHEKCYKVQVWRHVGLSGPEARRVSDYALKHAGDTYGWWKLGFHLADRLLFEGDKKLSRLLRVDDRPICSYLVAPEFEVVGVDFGIPAVATDPDEMLDHRERREQWRLVGRERL